MAKRKAQSLLSLTINDATVTGEKRRGKWTFECTWPELAEKYKGDDTTTGILSEFTMRALKPCITIRELAKGE